MKRFLITALLIATASSGCGKDDPAEADTGSVNGTTSDMGAGDTAANSGNSQTDMAQGRDMTQVSDMAQAADMGQTEDMAQAQDTGLADMAQAQDMTTNDVGPSEGCAAGYTRNVEVAGAVVACEGAADSVNQCDAAAACGSGWHMCTATEYRAIFEAVEPASAANANFWIASCIRSGGAPTSPSDLACTDCTGTQTGGSVDVAFSCVNAISVETDQLYVGVRSGSACTFAGVDMPGNDAYWNAQPSSTLQAGAFCCID